jgi:hypothetical protein
MIYTIDLSTDLTLAVRDTRWRKVRDHAETRLGMVEVIRMGPDEYRAAVGLTLVGMWACGYAIETRAPPAVSSSSGSKSSDARPPRPFPVGLLPLPSAQRPTAARAAANRRCGPVLPCAQPVYPKRERAAPSERAAVASPADSPVAAQPPVSESASASASAARDALANGAPVRQPTARRKKRQWSRRKPAMSRKAAEAAGFVSAASAATEPAAPA